MRRPALALLLVSALHPVVAGASSSAAPRTSPYGKRRSAIAAGTTAKVKKRLVTTGVTLVC